MPPENGLASTTAAGNSAMRMLWLAEDCRKAGLTVVEMPGWENRGAPFAEMPTTVLCHHTGTPATVKGDLPTARILIAGRSDLPGPLCQVGLGRSGTVYIIASGKANHAGKGAWKGETSSARTLGIEAEHPGVGAWPVKQISAYRELCGVLLRGIGQDTERLCGHKEWALPKGRKTDPNFPMGPFRGLVAVHLAALHQQAAVKPTPLPQEDDMPLTDDDVERIAKRVKQLVAQDLAVLLHGTKDGTHPANLDNIWQAVQPK